MRRTYAEKHYTPSKVQQRQLLAQEKDAIHNKGEHPLQANRGISSSIPLSSTGYITMGLLFSSIVLPMVRSQEETTPVTERVPNVRNSISGCEEVLQSLRNTTSRGACMLVEGEATHLRKVQEFAFGIGSVSKQKKPSDTGVNYKSSSLMEICVNASTAKSLRKEGLCSNTVQDPIMSYEITESLYREHQKTPETRLLSEEIYCNDRKIIGVSANAKNIHPITEEEDCHTESETMGKELKQYSYPTQNNRPIINPKCPSSLVLLSDGAMGKKPVQTSCIPMNAHNAKTLCQEDTMAFNKECLQGEITNARDCVLGQEAYDILQKNCPNIRVHDVRLVHHQRIGKNNTMPMLSVGSLVKAMDKCLEKGIIPDAIYITHPGTPIFTTPELTKKLQTYIDKFHSLGCTIILDTVSIPLQKFDLFMKITNIHYIYSMKEALEDIFVSKKEKKVLGSFLASLLSAGIVLGAGMLFLLKTKRDNQELEEANMPEMRPLNEETQNEQGMSIQIIQHTGENVEENTTGITAVLIRNTEELIENIEEHEAETSFFGSKNLLYIDAEEMEADIEEEDENSFFMKSRQNRDSTRDIVSKTESKSDTEETQV